MFNQAIWINIAMNIVKCFMCIAFVTLLIVSHEMALAQYSDESDFYFVDGDEVFLRSDSRFCFFGQYSTIILSDDVKYYALSHRVNAGKTVPKKLQIIQSRFDSISISFFFFQKSRMIVTKPPNLTTIQ